jgi:hypothetical protein
LQDLYDPDRVPGPRKRREGGDAGGDQAGGDETGGGDAAAAGFVEAGWEEGIAALGGAMQGGGVVLLTGASPTARDRFFEEWAAATGAEHVRWEPLEYEAARAANERDRLRQAGGSELRDRAGRRGRVLRRRLPGNLAFTRPARRAVRGCARCGSRSPRQADVRGPEALRDRPQGG